MTFGGFGFNLLHVNPVPIRSAFAKRLSANDIGATGGHQVGVYIARDLIHHFPDLDEESLNPRAEISLYHCGRLFRGQTFNFIHYNNRVVADGTRNEYRVTPFRSEDYEALQARTGDYLVFYRTAANEYELTVAGPGSLLAQEIEETGQQVGARGQQFELTAQFVEHHNEAEDQMQARNYTVPDAFAHVRVRRYQQAFRETVLRAYRYHCCLPGCTVDDPRFLEASHIISWNADPSRRVDPSNGLLLCQHHHTALDNGLFTLRREEARFVLEVGSGLDPDHYPGSDLIPQNGAPITPPRGFTLDPLCVEWHRTNVYRA